MRSFTVVRTSTRRGTIVRQVRYCTVLKRRLMMEKEFLEILKPCQFDGSFIIEISWSFSADHGKWVRSKWSRMTLTSGMSHRSLIQFSIGDDFRRVLDREHSPLSVGKFHEIAIWWSANRTVHGWKIFKQIPTIPVSLWVDSVSTFQTYWRFGPSPCLRT